MTEHDSGDVPLDPRVFDPNTWLALGMSPADAHARAHPSRWERDLWSGTDVRIVMTVGSVDGTLLSPVHLNDDGDVDVQVEVRGDWPDLNSNPIRLEHAADRWHLNGGVIGRAEFSDTGPLVLTLAFRNARLTRHAQPA